MTTQQAGDDREIEPSQAGKYLTCILGAEEYGLPVLRVREIIKVMTITTVPQAAPHVRGMINLRGKVIPVIDLRLKFGLPPHDDTDQTCIVVTDVGAGPVKAMMGLLVDGVSEVLNIAPQDIEAPPTFGAQSCTDYMRSVAKIKGTVKILLDIDEMLSLEALAALTESAA